MELVAHWGNESFTDLTVNNEILYMVNGYKLQVQDVSTPTLPELIGQGNFNLGGPEWIPKIVVLEDFAYILNYDEIVIVDISNPALPVQKTVYNEGGTHITLANHYAYIVGGRPKSAGLKILDISDPDSVTQIGSLYPEGTITFYWIAVQGNYAYLAEHNGLRIVDISTPANPKEIKYLRHSEGYDHVFTLAVEGNYVYVLITAELLLRILDISSPAEPKLIANYQLSDDLFECGAIHHCALKYPYLYLSGNSYDLLMLDVSDPSLPVAVEKFRMKAYPGSVIVQDDLIFVEGGDSSLYLMRNQLLTMIDHDRQINIPETFSVAQNYPNPFNSTTAIKFSLPNPEKIKIEIFNTLGQQVMTLLNEIVPAGNHEIHFDANGLSSGIYIYSITTSSNNIMKKMILIR